MKAEEKRPRWDKAQSILHTDDREDFMIENVFGTMRYMTEKESKKGEGFVIEAKEAPGVPTYIEEEKRLEPEKMKRGRKAKNERGLVYSSDRAFKNQAFFYELAGGKRSEDVLRCMELILQKKEHRTLGTAFEFVECSKEKEEKRMLEEARMQALSLEEFDRINKRIDVLNDWIRKKEFRKRQMRTTLQIMIDKKQEEKRKETLDVYDWKAEASFQELSQAASTEGDQDEEEKNEEIEKNKEEMSNVYRNV